MGDTASCSDYEALELQFNDTVQLMIDLYYWKTPNGHKITLFLEEAGLP